MHPREHYLAALREDYRRASKEQKTRLLNEARRRTRLNRKVLTRKLAHPAPALRPRKRGPRRKIYGAEVQSALIRVWEIVDFACGQRLAPALRQEAERLRGQGEARYSDEVAEKLAQISPRTIGRLLSRERQVRCLQRGRQASLHPLRYQKVPVKVASEWDTAEVGHGQLDYVGHTAVQELLSAGAQAEGEGARGEPHPAALREGAHAVPAFAGLRAFDGGGAAAAGGADVQLNVAQLWRTIQQLQNRLWDTLAAAEEASVRPRLRGPAPTLSGVAHKLWI